MPPGDVDGPVRGRRDAGLAAEADVLGDTGLACALRPAEARPGRGPAASPCDRSARRRRARALLLGVAPVQPRHVDRRVLAHGQGRPASCPRQVVGVDRDGGSEGLLSGAGPGCANHGSAALARDPHDLDAGPERDTGRLLPGDARIPGNVVHAHGRSERGAAIVAPRRVDVGRRPGPRGPRDDDLGARGGHRDAVVHGAVEAEAHGVGVRSAPDPAAARISAAAAIAVGASRRTGPPSEADAAGRTGTSAARRPP